MRSSLVFFVAASLVFNVDAWGFVGHRIVARLAQSQLDDEGKEWMNTLLPWHWRNNLSAMAPWADNILYEDTNPSGYPNWQWSRPLHYINVPDWVCEYNPERDCVNDTCIAGAIQNYTKRLETEFDQQQQEEALYFLIHFVGDIHQPLHTGFVGDRGANSIRGKFMNSSTLTNLHTVWDTTLISTKIRRNFSSNNDLYYEHIYNIMKDQKPVENDDQIETWIKENLNFVCDQIYQNEAGGRMNTSTNFTLGDEYYMRSIPIVEQRLAQSGRRLGAILNRLAKIRPEPPKEGLSAGMIALIVIVAVESTLILVIGGLFLYRILTKK